MFNDYKKLADALIKALTQSTEASLTNLDIGRRNYFEDTMNKANSGGTLYSTTPSYIQSRYDASTYLPSKAAAREKLNTATISIKGNLLDTKRQIDSVNRAAKELNSITFDHLLT